MTTTDAVIITTALALGFTASTFLSAYVRTDDFKVMLRELRDVYANWRLLRAQRLFDAHCRRRQAERRVSEEN